MDLPVLDLQNEGLGDLREALVRRGRMDICQVSPGVDGRHRGSYGCPSR